MSGAQAQAHTYRSRSHHCPEAGWAGKKNGELLALARGRYGVFITIDQNLTYQQNLGAAGIAVIVLRARDNRLETLLPLVPKVLAALQRIEGEQTVYIEPA